MATAPGKSSVLISLLSMTRGSQTYSYVSDGLGSVIALTNSSGSVTDSYTYDAFGEGLSHSGSSVNDFLFDAQQYDGASADYYLRARFYDETSGRFLSQDPFGGNSKDPITLHRYLYAGDDPVHEIDPGGEDFSLGETLASISITASFYSTHLTAVGIGAQIGFSFLYPDQATEVAQALQPYSIFGAEDSAATNVGRTARKAAQGFELNATRITEEIVGDAFQGIQDTPNAFEQIDQNVRQIMRVGSRRNVALADYQIGEDAGNLICISDKASGYVNDSVAGNPVMGIFSNDPYSTFDSERKILEQLASRYQSEPGIVGRVVLYSERRPCPSCSMIIQQFHDKFPHVEIHVISSLLKGNISYGP